MFPAFFFVDFYINTFLPRGWSLAIFPSRLFTVGIFPHSSHLPLAFFIFLFFFFFCIFALLLSYTWSGHFNAVMPESRTKMVIPLFAWF
ncbi:hypothetical protein BJX64DRAFT_106668 [Aspergillus heterothallicus]